MTMIPCLCFFKSDVLAYKKGQFVFKLKKKEAYQYVKDEFAVVIDNKLYKRFIEERNGNNI